MLDIKPLRYFLVLAEQRNFRRAAQLLHLSQPPLSRQIAALEQSLGVKLFERGTRHVNLTAAGNSFYQDAKSLLEQLQRAQLRAQQAAQGASGKLRIGFTMCSAYTVVPQYVRAMRAAFPEIELELKEIVSDDLPARILSGEIDVGVLLETQPQVGLRTLTVVQEPLCVALSRSHPKAAARKIKIADLQHDSFALTSAEGSSKLNADTLNFCRRNGFEPKVSFEVMLQQTMLSLVNDAACIALVPDSMRQLRMEGLVFKKLEQAPVVRQELAWASHNSNPCLPVFLQTCRPQPAAAGQ